MLRFPEDNPEDKFLEDGRSGFCSITDIDLECSRELFLQVDAMCTPVKATGNGISFCIAHQGFMTFPIDSSNCRRALFSM